MSSCAKHPFDQVAGMCGRCAYAYCRDCLVFTHGTSKPPHCIPCALMLAGVKTGGGPAPRLAKRELKAEMRSQRKAMKEAAMAGHDGELPMPPRSNSPVDFPDLDWAALEKAEAAFRAGPGASSFAAS